MKRGQVKISPFSKGWSNKHSGGQASFEYMILMGFVVMVLGAILSIAFYYAAGVQDGTRVNQLNSFAKRVVSSAESVYSSGYPSKITLRVYLPEGVTNVTLIENSLYIYFKSSTGLNKMLFPMQVPVWGNITNSTGIKKLEVSAMTNGTKITQI